jgi:O-antigen/teichoic acid export membrane protein
MRTTVQAALFRTGIDLSEKVITGAGYTFAGLFIRTFITLGSVAILARLLQPRDFGLIAMATVVTELAALLANLGFGAVLIQKRRISRLQADTVFWISVVLGVVLALIVFAVSYASAAFFDEPMAGRLLRVLCWAFVFEELTAVPLALLARSMRFRAQFFAQVAMISARAFVAVSVAYLGYGVWSLVIGSMAASMVQCAWLMIVSGYIPRARIDTSFIRRNFVTSSSYFGGGLLFYVNSNADLMLVGRILGADALGLYQSARSLTDEIRARIAMPLQRVLFPAFSAMNEDPARFHGAILKSARLLALVVTPVGFGIAAVANDLVPVLYGAKWLPMAIPLQLVSISAAIRAACSIASPIFNSINRVGLSFQVSMVGTVFTLVAVVVGSRWGLVGVAAGILVSSLSAILGYEVAFRVAGLRTSAVRQVLMGPLIASGSMWGVVYAIRHALVDDRLGGPLVLSVTVLAGATWYLFAVIVAVKPHVRDALGVIALLRNRLKPR